MVHEGENRDRGRAHAESRTAFSAVYRKVWRIVTEITEIGCHRAGSSIPAGEDRFGRAMPALRRQPPCPERLVHYRWQADTLGTGATRGLPGLRGQSLPVKKNSSGARPAPGLPKRRRKPPTGREDRVSSLS